MSNSHNNIRQHFHDTEAGQVYSWTAGTIGKPNVLFLHQSGNSADEYRGLVQFLADDYRLIAMDLPGHGRSYDPSSEPSVEEYAQAVEAILDAHDIKKAHIVGHHGGCYTAIKLLAIDPDRFDKAILSGLGGVKTREESQALRDLVLSTDTMVKPEPDFMGKAWGRYIDMASDGAKTPDTLKPFIAFLSARLKPHRGVLINLKFDKTPFLGKLRGPVLLVHGSKDFYITGQENLLPRIAGCERQIMDGSGAFMFYDRPEACAKLIRAYLER